ncbi:TVP38/TMEM64 family protein [Novispirillum sp. DQ9]|uniref:TVP38/TMEM64 family protein n=1 Tax=Novispirillum sp. DQ9 TaxID=3398612 RepID=UPI003C7CF327
MAEAPRGRRSTAARLAVLAVCLGVAGALYASGAHAVLDFDTLRRHRADLQGWVDGHAVLSVLAFLAAYAASVAFSLPGAVWLTVGGGFLFGTLASSLYVVVAATAGATGVFLLARYVTGDAWRRRLGEGRVGRMMARMESGFRDNALSTMLVLRLIPLFPFWLVNLVPALLGVPLWTYVVGTLLGIIPATVVFASIGAGLDEVLARGEAPDLSILFDPVVLGPLFGLAALAALPIAYKVWTARRKAP